MLTRNTRAAAVALLLAVGFAGCGDDADKSGASADGGSASSEQVVPPTPEENWAKEVCTAIAKQVKEVQPPRVESNDPADTQKALVTFFSQVGGQLEGQVEAIKTVGPPPDAATKAEWEKAVEGLEKTNAKITGIRKELRGANPKSSEDIDKIVASLSKDMQVLTQYDGAIAELKKNKQLGTALTTEPACASVS